MIACSNHVHSIQPDSIDIIGSRDASYKRPLLMHSVSVSESATVSVRGGDRLYNCA